MEIGARCLHPPEMLLCFSSPSQEACSSGVTREGEFNGVISQSFHEFSVSLPEKVFHSSEFG